MKTQNILYPSMLDHSLTFKREKLLRNYCRLANLEHLSKQDAELLGCILDEAQKDETLDFWITEIDCIIGEKLNLASEEECENKQVRLREHLVFEEDTKDNPCTSCQDAIRYN